MSLLRKAISLLFPPKSPKGDFDRVLIVKVFPLGTKGRKRIIISNRGFSDCTLEYNFHF